MGNTDGVVAPNPDETESSPDGKSARVLHGLIQPRNDYLGIRGYHRNSCLKRSIITNSYIPIVTVTTHPERRRSSAESLEYTEMYCDVSKHVVRADPVSPYHRGHSRRFLCTRESVADTKSTSSSSSLAGGRFLTHVSGYDTP